MLASIGSVEREPVMSAWQVVLPSPVETSFGALIPNPPGPPWAAIASQLSDDERYELAKRAMQPGYDSKTKLGGNLNLAREHLSAIGNDTTRAKDAKALMAELVLREVRTRQEFARRAEHNFGSNGTMRASGKDATVLRVNTAECSSPDALDQAIRENGELLRRVRFKSIECWTGDRRWLTKDL